MTKPNAIDRALYAAALKVVRPPEPMMICSVCRLDGCGHNVTKIGPYAICRCTLCPRVVVRG